MKFVYRDGQFVSSATAYFPDATTANTFYAYYPYNQTGFRSNTSSAVTPSPAVIRICMRLRI